MGWHGNKQAWCRALICASPAPFLKILVSGVSAGCSGVSPQATGLAPGHATARAQQQVPGNGCHLACVQALSRDTS